MTSPDRPTWVIRQENGFISEARTRAMMADRFWILDRSIDLDGADLIFQRRLTKRSLLDTRAPRLGFVQAKFYQDVKTTQYVQREYVLDQRGAPRREFFVICHTGLEDGARAFFLTAEELTNRFKLTDSSHSMPNRFELPGSRVLQRDFEILDRQRVLDLMEQALTNADLTSNRDFMVWAMALDDKSGPIKLEYVEKIDNTYGDIPSAFDDIRRKARAGLGDVQDAAFLLHDIATTDDPLVAMEKAEELSYGHGRAVRIPDDLLDSDFLNTVRDHLTRYKQLRDAGLLSSHAALRRQIHERIIADAPGMVALSGESIYILDTHYDAVRLELSRFETRNELETAMTLPTEDWTGRREVLSSGVIESRQGFIRAFVIPRRWFGNEFQPANGMEDAIRSMAGCVITEVMRAILLSRFGDTRTQSRRPP